MISTDETTLSLLVTAFKNRNRIKTLKIWGKAQCESDQHRKSNWGKNLRVEIPQVAKARDPNSNALTYAECAMLT